MTFRSSPAKHCVETSPNSAKTTGRTLAGDITAPRNLIGDPTISANHRSKALDSKEDLCDPHGINELTKPALRSMVVISIGDRRKGYHLQENESVETCQDCMEFAALLSWEANEFSTAAEQ